MDEDIKKVIDTFVKSHLGPLIEDLSDQALQLKFDKERQRSSQGGRDWYL
jgi:hypothetical protein